MKSHDESPQAFAELGIGLPLLRALRKVKFTEPSDIQAAMIPAALTGKDIMGQARTGTGKTAAFALPALQQIGDTTEFQAICLCPTRELAVQVAAEVRRLAEFTEVRCFPVYGGQRITTQLHLMGKRHQFLVGTPGRVLDLLRRRAISFEHIKVAILDEVDRMLDIGFRDDIKAILSHIKGKHQTIFVSATIDDEIKRLAKNYMTDPLDVNVSKDEISVDKIDQNYCTVERVDKYRLLSMLLKAEKPKLAIVFCNTKHAVRKLAKKLHRDGIEAKEIHGDLVQQKREKVMDRFRKHHIQVLIATDLAARGIDVSAITHIINYDIPQDIQVYVHRIGRTGRMGAIGKAITFVTREEGDQLTEVEKLINRQIPELIVEGFVETARPEEVKHDPTPSHGRLKESVFGSTDADSAPKRTLGSKFRPLRRRRRV